MAASSLAPVSAFQLVFILNTDAKEMLLTLDEKSDAVIPIFASKQGLA